MNSWLKGGPTKKVKSVCHIPEDNMVRVSPSKMQFFSARPLVKLCQVVAGIEGGDLTVWNTETGLLEEIISSHTNTVVKMTWLEDKRFGEISLLLGSCLLRVFALSEQDAHNRGKGWKRQILQF